MIIQCVPRVLVIENNDRDRQDIIKLLDRNGYRVNAIEKFYLDEERIKQDIRARACAFRPHVAVVDLRLRDEGSSWERTGLELISLLKPARCILFSAYVRDATWNVTREALLEAGAVDVIEKDEPEERLLAAVEKAVRERCACRHSCHFDLPSVWTRERIVRVVFEKDSTVPTDEVDDVLGCLFPDAGTLILKTLEGGAESTTPIVRGRSVVLQAWPDDREPCVVKLARHSKTAQEVYNYGRYVKDRLIGRFYAQLQAHVTFWDLGGICYDFIGSSLRRINTFAVFYQQDRSPEAITKPLRHFFGEVWQRRYADTRAPLTDSLFEAYDRFLKLRQRLTEFPNQDKALAFPGMQGLFPNPVCWVLEHEADSHIPTAYQAVTHGDLHGDNLLAEGEHAWAIDFERSGPGHILRDFVQLEQDIITRMASLPGDDLNFFYEFAVVLTTPESPDEPLRITGRLESDKEVRKALGVILGLRRLAREITGYQDVREYYWGLLLDALFGSTLTAKDSIKWQRGLLLAAVLCGRLQNWGKAWPPRRWPSLSEPFHPFDDLTRSASLSGLSPSLPAEYDAFLSYNNRDEEAIQVLAKLLRGSGIKIWLDRWNLLPGEPWQEGIEEALSRCKSYVAFWGPSGLGPWHHEEMRLAMERRVKEGLRVIPVLLPRCADPDEMPPLLRRTTWADFRQGLDNQIQLDRLIAGIHARVSGSTS